MRTMILLAATLIGPLFGAAVLAQEPAADARAAVRAVDRDVGQRNDEIQRLQGDEARARADLDACAALRTELAAREAHLAALDQRVVEAERALLPIEQLMGWNDTDWWGLPAWANKHVVPTLFGGDYGPHAAEYRAAVAALGAARKAREDAVARIDRELAALGGAAPRSLAALRRAVDAGEFEEQGARARLTRATDQLRAVQGTLERLAAQKRDLERELREHESTETVPVPSVSPAAETPRITGRVIEPTGLGRPENYVPIERCTWKFFVELTQEAGAPVNPYGGRIVSVQREPAGIQKGTPAAIGPGPTYTADRKLRAGPFYLTVQRPDGYRGSFRARFAFAGARGEEVSCEVAWNSPGRPPVGPPNLPPPSAEAAAPGALVVTGNLDKKSLDHKVHHVEKELGFPKTSYTADSVTLKIVPPAVAGQPWRGLISPAQVLHKRHLKHQPTRHRKPDLEEWWTVTITLQNGEGRRDAQTGLASVVHEYKTSWGAKARHVYPDERWHAVLQADGSYRMHMPGIEDGIPYRLEVTGDR